jgi:hypothetical protein
MKRGVGGWGEEREDDRIRRVGGGDREGRTYHCSATLSSTSLLTRCSPSGMAWSSSRCSLQTSLISAIQRFKIQGSRVQDFGFKIQDSGFRIQDSGSRTWDPRGALIFWPSHHLMFRSQFSNGAP